MLSAKSILELRSEEGFSREASSENLMFWGSVPKPSFS
jgi:hypothetical protein